MCGTLSLHGGPLLPMPPPTQIEKTAASDLPPGGISSTCPYSVTPSPPAPRSDRYVIVDRLSFLSRSLRTFAPHGTHPIYSLIARPRLRRLCGRVYQIGPGMHIRSISPIPGPGQLIYLSYSGISYTLCNIPPPASCLLVLPIPSHAITLEDIAIRR
jgi:hypothetical protein